MGTVAALIAERQRLEAELAGFSFLETHPSCANFVLCRVVGRDAAELKQFLARQGILVRHYARPGLENYIRVSAGKPEHTVALLAALTGLA
jgi:histidinol-phosphate aminotransferase